MKQAALCVIHNRWHFELIRTGVNTVAAASGVDTVVCKAFLEEMYEQCCRDVGRKRLHVPTPFEGLTGNLSANRLRESEMVGLDVARLFLKTKPRVCGQVSAAAWF